MMKTQGNVHYGSALEMDKAIRERIKAFKDSPSHWEGFFHIGLVPSDLGGINLSDIRIYLGGLWDVRQSVPMDGNQWFNPVYDTQQLESLGIKRLEGFQRGNRYIIVGYDSHSFIVWVNMELIP